MVSTSQAERKSVTGTATRNPASVGAAPGKALNATLWIVQVLLALVFVFAGGSKLLGRPDMVALFQGVGFGQWLRYVTGICELAGAVLIVVPRTASLGALLLAAIMLAATATNLFILHVSPVPSLVLFLLACFVVWGRRRELAALLGRGSQD
jgi:uncharacterized membrane protein